MMGIKDERSMFCQKVNFSWRQQIISHFSNKNFWTIRYQAHPQQRTALQLTPSVRNVKADRCILSLYICITIQQQFILPISHSRHTHSIDTIWLQVQFLFHNLFKIDHKFRSVNLPFFWGGLSLIPNFQKVTAQQDFNRQGRLLQIMRGTFLGSSSFYIKN